MIKTYQIVLLCYVGFVLVFLIDFGDADKDVILHRPKRYLSFNNITRCFLRLNFKANIVPWNQLFAQAIGFRMNWDAPPNSFHPHHHLHIQRRAVYNSLEVLMDKNGLNGFHCIRRAICEMREVNQPREIYHRILKMVFSQRTSATDKWHSVKDEECYLSYHSCPFSLLDVSQYTDL